MPAVMAHRAAVTARGEALDVVERQYLKSGKLNTFMQL